MPVAMPNMSSPDGFMTPSAEFKTVVVLSPDCETLWQRLKRFVLRRGRLQPRSRRPRSRRQSGRAPAGVGQHGQFGRQATSPLSPAGSGLRGLTRCPSQSSIHDAPSLRDELAGAWPRLGLDEATALGRRNHRSLLRRSGSDGHLARTLGYGIGSHSEAHDDSDYVSELGTVSEATVSHDEGRPYPWMDTPIQGLDSWMMY